MIYCYLPFLHRCPTPWRWKKYLQMLRLFVPPWTWGRCTAAPFRDADSMLILLALVANLQDTSSQFGTDIIGSNRHIFPLNKSGCRIKGEGQLHKFWGSSSIFVHQIKRHRTRPQQLMWCSARCLKTGRCHKSTMPRSVPYSRTL